MPALTRRCSAAFALGIVSLIAPGSGMSARPSITTIDVPGATSTRAFGINSSGTIVGAYTDASGASHGFLLRKGEFRQIDYPGARGSQAWGINGKGQIVGRYSVGDGKTHGFLLSKGTFSPIDVPGDHKFTLPTKINDAGVVVGCVHDVGFTQDMHGFSRVGSSFKTFGLLGSMHNGISASGKELAGVWYDPGGVQHGYLLRRGKYLSFDYPGAAQTSAWDLTRLVPRGSSGSRPAPPSFRIVGTYQDAAGRRHGFAATAGRGTRLAFAPIDVAEAAATEAYGVNQRGDVVGLYVDSENRTHGFVRRR